ncbi:MAG: CubicO group peptidase (beta-lactamase class C family), partial [Candidatus Azotimanducaceae bacterium]
AVMSLGGSWDGTEYLNDDAWTALHGEPLERDMGFSNTIFTQGGLAQFPKIAPPGAAAQAFKAGREGYFGWMGLGGSIFQWQPEHQIGFGYVPTSLNVLDLFNERGKSYQAVALRCVAELG